MANIPLVQVPNAPQTGSAAVPLPVGAIRTPDVELMGMIDDASYLAVGRAYSNLGNEGMKAAAVMGDFALSMATAQDEANLAAADRIKTDVMAKFDAEVATKPESEWSSIWENNYATKFREQVSGLPMATRAGLNRRDVWLANTENTAKADIYTKANKKLIERGGQELRNLAERARLEGRTEDQIAAWKRGASVGFWTPEYAESEILKAEHAMKWETVTGMVQTNPHASVQDLEEAVNSGKESGMFSSLKTASDRGKALSMAYGERRRMDAMNSRDAVEKILDGTISDSKQIDELYPSLDLKDREAIKATLEATPEQIAKRLQIAPAVQQMINAYEPEDDFDGTKSIAVRQYIYQLPEGYRLPYLDQLGDKIRSNKPVPPNAVKEIRRLAQADFEGMRYGKWKVDDKGNPKNDEESAKRDAAMMAYSREMTAFDRWAKRNPDATDEQAYAEINRIRRNIYEAEKGSGKESTRMPNMSAPDPREALKKAQQLRGQPQASAGGVYREGNIGPTSTGPHFDIKREDRGYWDRGSLDSYVLVNGEPLSRGKTVSGGAYGASRSYGQHKGWDFAFGGNGNLTLTNGAVWLGVHSTKHGDKARFRTPDGAVYEILHGKFESAS